MSNAVMPLDDYKRTCDTIREKTKSTNLIKSGEMPEGINAVYEAGQKSMVDESKIIKGTATGEGSITLNDVSEIPHKIKATIKVNESETFIAADVHYHFEMPYDDTKPMPIKETNEAENKIICEYEYSIDGIEIFPHICTITVLEGFDFSILKGALVGIVSSYDATEFTVVHAKATSITLTVTDNDTKSATYTPNADGVIDNIVSYSPNMKFKLDGTNEITVEYHKSWGMQEEWNRFWEELQSGGSAMNYYYAFCYDRFNDKNFNPKYPIKCSNGATTSRSIFYYNRVLTDTKVEIIVSSNNMNYCFQSASALKTIRKLTVKETTTYTDAFTGCEALENITISGTIGQNISFANSRYLTDESVDSIVSALKDLTGATAKTITVHANVYARMVERGVDALVTAKNWTLVSG